MRVSTFHAAYRVETHRGVVSNKISFVVGTDGCERIDIEPGHVAVLFAKMNGRPAETFYLTASGYGVTAESAGMPGKQEQQHGTSGKKK